MHDDNQMGWGTRLKHVMSSSAERVAEVHRTLFSEHRDRLLAVLEDSGVRAVNDN